MTYELEFDERALKEWKKLNKPIQEQFKKKLQKILDNPRVDKNKLSGDFFKDCYKIKLRSSGYRLVYKVEDSVLIVLVITIGKRERSEIYNDASLRISNDSK